MNIGDIISSKNRHYLKMGSVFKNGGDFLVIVGITTSGYEIKEYKPHSYSFHVGFEAVDGYIYCGENI